jgi:hypothetical protein
VMEQSLVFLAAAAKGRARRAKLLGAGATVHVVGPAEGWQSLSIPSNMKEPEAHGRMTGVFPSPAVAAFPGKSSGKRMARGIQETGVDGLTQYFSLTPNLLAYAFKTRRTVSSSSFMCVSSSSFCNQ